MLKRVLTVASGVALGSVFALGGAHLAFTWGWFGNRELDKSANYVREVLALVNENYVDGPSAEYSKLTKAALHGVVESLDPHSEFLEASDYQQLEEEMSSEFGGIGVQLEQRNNHVIVISPIADSPSERAGIRRGDELVQIDGNRLDSKSSSMDAIVGKLRGKPRTRVNVGFLRPSTNKEYQVTLVRELIKFESVRAPEIVSEGIGYIQITQFTERTGEEFINALNKLGEKNVGGLIIDLRNNPGGVLDAAVAVAEPFFKKGELIVYTQGRNPKDRDEYRAESDEEPLDVPTVVLINAGSASAAEIVAGALRDTGKAVVVGERSFGKGSVQSIFKLNNGEGMRLTTARYYTPSGVTLHEKGVEPHVEIVMSPEEDQNIRLQRARNDVNEDKAFKERFGVDRVEDRQLQAGIDIIKAARLLEARDSLQPAPAAAATAPAPAVPTTK
ncbi:MAG TPA: S41 family peptidase [Opitutaceae bacterium]|nr:S41 family peptidase [Opitutaceae bacterium]